MALVLCVALPTEETKNQEENEPLHWSTEKVLTAHANRAPRREAARVSNSKRSGAVARSGSASCWAANRLERQVFIVLIANGSCRISAYCL